jgi:hypothetical protein
MKHKLQYLTKTKAINKVEQDTKFNHQEYSTT